MDHRCPHQATPTKPDLHPPTNPHASTFHVDAPVGPAHVAHHNPPSRGCFSHAYDSMLSYAFFFVVERHGYVRPLVASPLPRVLPVQGFTRNDELAQPLPAVTKRPRDLRQCRALRTSYPSHHGNTPTTLFLTSRFSRSADMCALPEARFTASGTRTSSSTTLHPSLVMPVVSQGCL